MITNTGEEARKIDLQMTTAKWLRSGNHNAFVTLTFRDEGKVSYAYAERTFGRFINSLRGALFGKRSKRRLALVPVIEGYDRSSFYRTRNDLHIHIHCLIQLPGTPREHMSTVAELWKGTDRRCGDPDVYCPNSNDWFLTPDSDDFKDKVTTYSLKTCGADTDAILWKYVSFGSMI